MTSSDTLKIPGIHEKEIIKFFKGDVKFTGQTHVFEEPLYLLAFSNRSGSNLLASHLRTVPYFGGFHEQLIYSTVQNQATEGGCRSFPELIQFASTNYGRPGAKAWGFKASWDQIMMLYRFGIDRMYPEVRIIHITRRDIIAQAVSYSIATQTKKWTSKHEGLDGVLPQYDYRLLCRLVEESLMSELHVRTIATLFEASYLNLRYEAMMLRPKKIMGKVGNFANLDVSNWSPTDPPIEKQFGEINRRFYQQYMMDRRAALLATELDVNR